MNLAYKTIKLTIVQAYLNQVLQLWAQDVHGHTGLDLVFVTQVSKRGYNSRVVLLEVDRHEIRQLEKHGVRLVCQVTEELQVRDLLLAKDAILSMLGDQNQKMAGDVVVEHRLLETIATLDIFLHDRPGNSSKESLVPEQFSSCHGLKLSVVQVTWVLYAAHL